MKTSMKQKTIVEKSKDKTEVKKKYHNRYCYNCGAEDHVSANCPSKAKSIKYFRCDTFSHTALKCPRKENKPD